MYIKLVNGLHINMWKPKSKWEFIPLTKKEFYAILNKNRANIKSYIGHRELAKQLRVKCNRENTYTEIGDILLLCSGKSRKNAVYREEKGTDRYLVLITPHHVYYSEKRLEEVKKSLMI